MIAVSVIMPVYNTKHDLLCRAIESVLQQSLREIELILVDDGSTNGSERICDEYAMKDSRVHVLHEKNGGLCKARNTALRIVKGEYVTFIDHDDEYGEGQLGENYRLAKEQGNVDVVKFGYRYICLDQRPRFPFRTYNGTVNKALVGRELLEAYPKLKDSGILTFVWDALFRTDFLREHSLLFNEKFKIGQEDIEFCNRVYSNLQSFVYHSKQYYRHYRYPASTSRGMDLQKTKRLLRDEAYVFQGEIELWRKMYPPEAEDVRQSIAYRNMMVMISSAMRSDAEISFFDRIGLVRWIRGKFEGKGAIDCHYPHEWKNRLCTFLFQYNAIFLLVIASVFYVKYLTWCVKGQGKMND